MIKTILTVFLCLAFALPVRAQSDNAPLPEAEYKISVPHSERTKANIADSLLDFLLIKAFSRLKDISVSYDFFELQPQGVLHFTGFSIQMNRASAQGNVKFSSFTVDAKELLSFLNTRTVALGKVEMRGVSADLRVGHDKTAVQFDAASIGLTQLRLLSLDENSKNEAITVESAVLSDVRYASKSKCHTARNIAATNIQIRSEPPKGVFFDSAVVDSKNYATVGEIGIATEKACGKRR